MNDEYENEFLDTLKRIADRIDRIGDALCVLSRMKVRERSTRDGELFYAITPEEDE